VAPVLSQQAKRTPPTPGELDELRPLVPRCLSLSRFARGQQSGYWR